MTRGKPSNLTYEKKKRLIAEGGRGLRGARPWQPECLSWEVFLALWAENMQVFLLITGYSGSEILLKES